MCTLAQTICTKSGLKCISWTARLWYVCFYSHFIDNAVSIWSRPISLSSYFLFLQPLYSPSVWVLRLNVSLRPLEKPSPLWLVSSHRPEQALPTLFQHQVCWCFCKHSSARGRGWEQWLYSRDTTTLRTHNFWKQAVLLAPRPALKVIRHVWLTMLW